VPPSPSPLEDAALLAEIALLADVIVAAMPAPSQLSQAEVDDILGVGLRDRAEKVT